ncbi:MAG TPA: hypothetical protein VEW48_14795 [Thermoanaerobaculia bacterium]|nr:hypothetical protein [Thermoanaerobaculia bacterium]
MSLSVQEVPAKGRQEAILTVDRFGRYSVRVESAQGTSIELIDRMAGSLGRSGEPGRENGRLDLILDRGTYKLVLESHEKGKGTAKVQAAAFHDRGTPGTALPRLPSVPENRLVQETLEDLEQLSYWLEVSERREVRAEAAGRHLSDLRLWRGGSWLEGAEPECATVQPVTGQPLLRCRLAAVLDPGLYLLVAYGGPPQPWAEGSDEHPLWLRWGAPDLGEAGRRRLVVSPFGEDWFHVSDSVNFARLELPEALPAGVQFHWVRTGRQLSGGHTVSGAITKESVPPAAEISADSRPADDEEDVEATQEGEEEEQSVEDESSEEESTGDQEATYEESSGEEEEPAGEETAEGEETEEDEGDEAPAAAPAELPVWQLWLSVSAAPGQAYVLQYFERKDVYSLQNLSGPYWVSSVHAGAAVDSIDATGLLTVQAPSENERLLDSRAIPLDAQTTWGRRFNLLETATLFLEVRAQGRYRVVATETPARVRVEPFLLTRPEHYEPPAFQGSDSVWNLDPGFYVLTLEPERQGIVDVRIRPAIQDGKAQEQPVRAAVHFAPVQLDVANAYRLYMNDQPGVTSGLVARPWPVDLSHALPVALQPGEELKIAFKVAEAGILRADAEDGSRLPVSVDGVPSIAEASVEPGDHELTLRNELAKTVLLSVAVEPLAVQGTMPLPPLPDAALAALPKFPVLRTGAPQFLDLKRNAGATFFLQADKPALYEIRSTGLLSTSGTLRTRTVPELRGEEENGVGRNFLLQQYLREGDYQTTVSATGKSRGHLGVEIAATPVDDAGELRPEFPARWTLPAGRAAVWRFTIPREGTYTLRAEGLQVLFHGRVEDADGWPIEPPNRELDFSRTYAAGTYRLVLLPQPVDTRALIQLEREAEPLHFTGHGPHDLPLETAVEHQWVEPEGEAPRQPDVWRFTVPARLTATVSLTEEMEGVVSKIPSPPAPLPQAGEGSRLAKDNSEPAEPSNPHPSPTRGRGAGGEGSEIGRVPPGRSWTGELEPGAYQIAAQCSRRNNLVSYTVDVSSRELVAGLSRSVKAPVAIPVSVGPDGLIELASVAPSDVRARLLDESGREVAEGDDRPDGWDFLLFQRLAPGHYTLAVDPVGVAETDLEVTMRAAAEAEEATLPLPFHGDVRLGESVLLRPLAVGNRSDLLLVAARSKDSLGLSVEVRDGNGWRTLGTSIARAPRLEIPLERQEGRSYRLRLWSLDRQGTPVRLHVADLAAPRVSEGDLRRGAALREVPGFDPPVGAGVLSLDRPGVFRVSDAAPGLRGGGAPGRPLAPLAPGEAQEGILSAPGERAWVVREGKTRVVKAERIEAAPGLEAGVRFPLPPEGAVLDLTDRSDRSDRSDEKTNSGPLVALATAPSGQPGVRLGRRGEPGEPNAATMAVGTGSALAVSLELRRPVARVWSAAGESGAPVEEVRLAWVRLPEAARETASWGVRDGNLDGLTARRLALPEGARTLRISLGEGTAAVLSRGDEVLATSWHGGAPFQELLADDGAATHLTLLHLRAGSDPFSVELLPAGGEGDLALRTGQPVERLLDRAGVLRLEAPVSAVQLKAGRTLHVRGAGAEAEVLGRDGGVDRGMDLPLPAGGTVLVRHGTGLLLAWLEQEGEEQNALWPVPPDEKPVRVEPPARVPLAGPFLHLLIPAGAPRVLHVRTAVPVATLLRRGESGAPEVEVQSDGARLDTFVPGGEVRLGLRALAGAQLSGSAEITTTPVTAIAEGLGPAVLLPAGATRWFSFHLNQKGPIGAGVRSTDDRVELDLYDRGGRRLAGREGGVVRMVDLEPGDYLLALRAPADGPPVTARPALAGVVPPDTGPPEDVVRQYLQKAGEEETAPGATENENENQSDESATPESGSGRES